MLFLDFSVNLSVNQLFLDYLKFYICMIVIAGIFLFYSIVFQVKCHQFNSKSNIPLMMFNYAIFFWQTRELLKVTLKVNDPTWWHKQKDIRSKGIVLFLASAVRHIFCHTVIRAMPCWPSTSESFNLSLSRQQTIFQTVSTSLFKTTHVCYA